MKLYSFFFVQFKIGQIQNDLQNFQVLNKENVIPSFDLFCRIVPWPVVSELQEHFIDFNHPLCTSQEYLKRKKVIESFHRASLCISLLSKYEREQVRSRDARVAFHNGK